MKRRQDSELKLQRQRVLLPGVEFVATYCIKVTLPLGPCRSAASLDLINTARVSGFIITDKVSRRTLSEYQCPPKKPTIRCRPIGATSTRVEKEGDGF